MGSSAQVWPPSAETPTKASLLWVPDEVEGTHVLVEREHTILLLIARGLTNDEIAGSQCAAADQLIRSCFAQPTAADHGACGDHRE
jgi:hypothetical protein